MNSLRFVLGEQRYLEFEVRPRRTDDTVVITEATWSLQQNGATVEAGNCKVDGKIVRALIAPANKGMYQLDLSVTVPPETRKERLMLYVD
ncbi:hypothetical protein ACS3UN_02230 [Oscillospiraceae bacterium LTW-04]|nr:hypothetical protein RBH76_08230 [Oscillospiraceae bacterium MB24-C1]